MPAVSSCRMGRGLSGSGRVGGRAVSGISRACLAHGVADRKQSDDSLCRRADVCLMLISSTLRYSYLLESHLVI